MPPEPATTWLGESPARARSADDSAFPWRGRFLRLELLALCEHFARK
jgi:hypothetical protein